MRPKLLRSSETCYYAPPCLRFGLRFGFRRRCHRALRRGVWCRGLGRGVLRRGEDKEGERGEEASHDAVAVDDEVERG